MSRKNLITGSFLLALVLSMIDLSYASLSASSAPKTLEQVTSILELTLNELASYKLRLDRLEEEKAELKSKVDYLEAITANDVPRTCEDLRRRGVRVSGSYKIDPDGATVGEEPFVAVCDFDSSHDGKAIVEYDFVRGFESATGGSRASRKQIRALLSVSKSCQHGTSVVDGIQVGQLICSGRKEFKATESCETLQLAGQTVPGYYIVDGPDGINYDLVECNLDQEAGSADFQVATSVKLAEFPVAFDFMRTRDLEGEGVTITFPNALLNVGDAMATNGVFTVPLDGVYVLSFYFHEWVYEDRASYVEIQVDGTQAIATVWIEFDSSGLKRGSGTGDTVVAELKAGQTVSAVLVHGAIDAGEAADAHFTGHLLFPL